MTEKNNETQEQPEGTFDTFFEHQRKAAEEAGKALETLLPPGFKEHAENAVNESIAGFKVLVDALLGEIQKSGDEEDGESSTGKNKVKVEVN